MAETKKEAKAPTVEVECLAAMTVNAKSYAKGATLTLFAGTASALINRGKAKLTKRPGQAHTPNVVEAKA